MTDPTPHNLSSPELSIGDQIRHLLAEIGRRDIRLTLLEAQDQFRRIFFGAPTLAYSQITPQLMVGGQHYRHGLRELAQRGVTAVVNMRGEHDDRLGGVALEHYLHLPTKDGHPPSLEHLRLGVEFIRTHIDAGGKVYIHCWEGVGRAPTMAAAYLASTGMTPEAAWETIRAARPFIRPHPHQIAQVIRFLEMLDAYPL